MLKVLRETSLLLSKKDNEISSDMFSDQLLVVDPRLVLHFDCVNVITPPPDNSGQMEEFGVFVPEFEAELPRFLTP